MRIYKSWIQSWFQRGWFKCWWPCNLLFLSIFYFLLALLSAAIISYLFTRFPLINLFAKSDRFVHILKVVLMLLLVLLLFFIVMRSLSFNIIAYQSILFSWTCSLIGRFGSSVETSVTWFDWLSQRRILIRLSVWWIPFWGDEYHRISHMHHAWRNWFYCLTEFLECNFRISINIEPPDYSDKFGL